MWFGFAYQGASRTTEDGDREKKTGDERDERIGGGLRGPAARGLAAAPNPPAANRVRNGPEQANSNPASRVQQSGEFDAKLQLLILALWFHFIPFSFVIYISLFVLRQMD